MAPSHKSLTSSGRAPGPSKTVSVLDLVVLLGNLYQGLTDREVGFEDADLTVNELISHLNRYVNIPRASAESALWSCNLLNERGKFWDPKGRTFDQFLTHICSYTDSFNKDYNFLEKKK